MNYLQEFRAAFPKDPEKAFILGLETREPEVQAILKVVELLMLSDFLRDKELSEAKSDLKKIQSEYKTSIAFLKEEIEYSE